MRIRTLNEHNPAAPAAPGSFFLTGRAAPASTACAARPPRSVFDLFTAFLFNFFSLAFCVSLAAQLSFFITRAFFSPLSEGSTSASDVLPA